MRKLALAGLLGIALPLAAAQAADTIRGGNWQFTVTAQLPNMPNLPAGVKLPPNVRAGVAPGGMTVTHTSCIKANDPTEVLRRPQGPMVAASHCGIQKLERVGGMASWDTTCVMPDAVVHSAGTAHFNGDRMEGSFKTLTTPTHGSPIEVTDHVVGRYLGPCASAQ